MAGVHCEMSHSHGGPLSGLQGASAEVGVVRGGRGRLHALTNLANVAGAPGGDVAVDATVVLDHEGGGAGQTRVLEPSLRGGGRNGCSNQRVPAQPVSICCTRRICLRIDVFVSLSGLAGAGGLPSGVDTGRGEGRDGHEGRCPQAGGLDDGQLVRAGDLHDLDPALLVRGVGAGLGIAGHGGGAVLASHDPELHIISVDGYPVGHLLRDLPVGLRADG